MTALLVEARRPIDRPADDGFEVSYVAGDGAEHRGKPGAYISTAEAAEVSVPATLQATSGAFPPTTSMTSRAGQVGATHQGRLASTNRRKNIPG